MQEENVICYEYQKLKENKNNYATHDLELATKVCILKLWRHYVTCRKFELWIDHLSLKWFIWLAHLNAQQAIWLEFLCEFEVDIKHIKGEENKVVDALRRKFHIVAISMCRKYLRTRIHEAAGNDDFFLQDKG